MKTRYKIFIMIGDVVVFIVWSMIDMTCKPCIVPPDAPDNYYIAGLKQGKISLENGRASGYHIFDSSEVDLIKEIKTLRDK